MYGYRGGGGCCMWIGVGVVVGAVWMYWVQTDHSAAGENDK